VNGGCDAAFSLQGYFFGTGEKQGEIRIMASFLCYDRKNGAEELNNGRKSTKPAGGIGAFGEI
jgi:hypothetical protein